MLKILKALYCHLPPLSPHHHHQKAANQRRKEIEIDFQNEIPQILEHWEKIKFERKKAYCKYRRWLRNQGLSQTVPTLAAETEALLGQNILLLCFVLFQKAETGKGNLRKQTIACRIYFLTTVQDNSSFVEWINIYWFPHECQALCSAEDVLVNLTVSVCMPPLN